MYTPPERVQRVRSIASAVRMLYALRNLWSAGLLTTREAAECESIIRVCLIELGRRRDGQSPTDEGFKLLMWARLKTLALRLLAREVGLRSKDAGETLLHILQRVDEFLLDAMSDYVGAGLEPPDASHIMNDVLV